MTEELLTIHAAPLVRLGRRAKIARPRGVTMELPLRCAVGMVNSPFSFRNSGLEAVIERRLKRADRDSEQLDCGAAPSRWTPKIRQAGFVAVLRFDTMQLSTALFAVVRHNSLCPDGECDAPLAGLWHWSIVASAPSTESAARSATFSGSSTTPMQQCNSPNPIARLPTHGADGGSVRGGRKYRLHSTAWRTTRRRYDLAIADFDQASGSTPKMLRVPQSAATTYGGK